MNLKYSWSPENSRTYLKIKEAPPLISLDFHVKQTLTGTPVLDGRAGGLNKTQIAASNLRPESIIPQGSRLEAACNFLPMINMF